MAGGLTISTLNDSTGVLATQNGMSGIAKAWVNFNGSTAAIRASMNVSSITRSATGTYTISYTTSMPDANYAVCGTAGWGVAAPKVTISPRESSFATGSVIIDCFDMGATNNDSSQIGVAIHR